MSTIVPVAFPVLHRYRPPRVRKNRHGYGKGLVSVALRHLEERPREVARIGTERILAADGRAWTPLLTGGTPITPEALAGFLSEGDGYHGQGEKILASWARQSPLMFVNANKACRAGDVDARGAAFLDDGTERCAADVREFLDDRVRLHEGRVLVREERLLGLHKLDRARPEPVFGPYPRHTGTEYYANRPSLLAVRPDRLAAFWSLHDRPMRGEAPTGKWAPLAALPEDLLCDDDVAWMANRLPALCITHMRSSWYAFHESTQANQEAHHVLMQTLAQHARLGQTGSVTGARMEPVLRDCLQALARMIELRKVVRATSDEDIRVFASLARTVEGEFLPRLAGPVRPEDEADLAGLAHF